MDVLREEVSLTSSPFLIGSLSLSERESLPSLRNASPFYDLQKIVGVPSLSFSLLAGAAYRNHF